MPLGSWRLTVHRADRRSELAAAAARALGSLEGSDAPPSRRLLLPRNSAAGLLASCLASEAAADRWLSGAVAQVTPSTAGSFPVTAARLAVVALLLLLAMGFARVLIELWIERRRKRRLATTRDISALTPSDFERYVAILFEEAGYRVTQTGGSGDHGVDLVVQQGGTRSVVQCKRYEDAIGPSTIRELIGAITNAGMRDGYLVTTSDFTAGAQREARKAPYRIGLIDGDTLVRWARAHGLPGELMDQG